MLSKLQIKSADAQKYLVSVHRFLAVQVPSAIANFPKEITKSPRSWANSLYNVQQWSIFPQGGHFAAKEQPEALAYDIQKFFGNKLIFKVDTFQT